MSDYFTTYLHIDTNIMRLDFFSKRPLCLFIYASIKAFSDKNLDFKVSCRKIAECFNASFTGVNRAMKELIDNGYLTTVNDNGKTKTKKSYRITNKVNLELKGVVFDNKNENENNEVGKSWLEIESSLGA